MECRTCGATLREGARFCNTCGAIQVDASLDSPQDTPAVSPDGTLPASGSDSDSSSRARRPARVPRATNATDATDSLAPSRSRTIPVETNVLDPAALAMAEQHAASSDSMPLEASEAEATELAEPETVEDDSAAPATSEPAAEMDTGAAESVDAEPTPETQPASASGESSDTPVTPPAASTSEATASEPGAASPEDAPSAAGTPASEVAWEDADTVEYNVILQRSQSLDGILAAPQPADMSALDELARPHGDALPWPLPESIIIGGRYRVEEVLTTVPDAPDAENVYRINDLQGYERCWSCGAEHGSDAASDRFCQECGADMLSRDFLMYERRQEEESADSPAEAAGGETEESEHVFTQGARLYRIVPRAAEPPLFPRGARLVAVLATDTGASRAGEENEDSAGVFTLCVAHDSHSEPLSVCVVADGLGGHASGQEASRLAVRILAEHILRTVALPYISAPAGASAGASAEDPSFEAGLIASLKDGVEAANKAICARNKSTRADMGSTCVAALVYRETAYFINVGDSRGYVLEDGDLRRVTTDHSLVEQLIAGGLVAPEERYTHPQRNQIFRSLGDEPNVPLDTFTQKLRPGMRLLLCSDGLWEMVRDDEMARILRDTHSPQQACDLLISAANEHGGEDNISAIVIDISA